SPTEPHHRTDHHQERPADKRDTDDAPYRGGRDRNAEGLGCGFTASGGAHRGDIVPGHRLGCGRDERLHLFVFVGGDTVDGFWFEADLPAGWSRARQLDLFGRRRAGIGEDHRDRRLLAGGSLGAEDAFAAGDIDLRLTRDVEDKVGRCGGVIGRYFRRHLVFAGCDRVRRTYLEFHVLRLAGIERKGVELLATILLGERGIEVLRRLRGQAHQHLLGAVILDGELELEARFGSAAQLGELRIERELGRQIGGELYLDGKRRVAGRALCAHRQVRRADRGILRHSEAQLERHAGMGRGQRRRRRLAATDQGRGPARRNPANPQRQALRRKAVILQLEIDRRSSAWAQGDRRVIGEKE